MFLRTVRRPTPPFFFIIPRCVYRRPATGPFPQMEHTFANIQAFLLVGLRSGCQQPRSAERSDRSALETDIIA